MSNVNPGPVQSDQLFDGLNFYMRPCSVRLNIRTLIEKHGGMFSRDNPNHILLTDALDHTSGYHIDFIYDSISKERLRDMERYKLPLYGFKNVDGENIKIPSLCLHKARQQFIPEEDAAIFNYVNKFVGREGCAGSIGGNMLWKEMERKKITMHPWQSMKNRYNNHIKQQPPKFYFQPLEMGISRDRVTSAVTNNTSPLNISEVSAEASPIISTVDSPTSSTPKETNASINSINEFEEALSLRDPMRDQFHNKNSSRADDVTNLLSSQPISNQGNNMNSNINKEEKNEHTVKLRKLVDTFKTVGTILENDSAIISKSKLKEIEDIFRTAAVSLEHIADDTPDKLPKIVDIFQSISSSLSQKAKSCPIDQQPSTQSITAKTLPKENCCKETQNKTIPSLDSDLIPTEVKTTTPKQTSFRNQNQSTSGNLSTNRLSELFSPISDWDFDADTSSLRSAVQELRRVCSQVDPECNTEVTTSSIDMFQSVAFSQSQEQGDTSISKNSSTKINSAENKDHGKVRNSTLLPLEPIRQHSIDQEKDCNMELLKEVEKSLFNQSDPEPCDCYEEYDIKANDTLLDKIETATNDESFLKALCNDLLLEELAFKYHISVFEVKDMINN